MEMKEIPFLQRIGERRSVVERRQCVVGGVMRLRGHQDLPQMVLTLQPPRRFTSGLHRRHQDGQDQSDNGHRHDQLDDRDPASTHVPRSPSSAANDRLNYAARRRSAGTNGGKS
jgi:hypothetical protein